MTTPQWTPAEILHVEPNCLGLTCIGHAKTQGRRCRNPIAYANRQEAANILLDIARLDPRSPRLDYELEELASYLLCRRWHQDQAAAIKRQWRRDIQNYLAVEGARRVERLRMVERPSTPARTPVARPWVTTTRREVVASSITTSVTRESASVTIVSIVMREESSIRETDAPNEESNEREFNAANEEALPRRQANPEANSSSDRQQETTDRAADISPSEPSTVERTSHTTAPSVEAQHTTAREDPQQEPARDPNAPNEEEAPRQQTNPESHSSNRQHGTTDRQAETSTPEQPTVERITAPSVETQHTTTAREDPLQEPASEAEPAAAISSAPTQTRQSQHEDSHPAHHGRRAVEDECAICCEDFSASDDTRWCRAQCRQNFHADCIELWHASQEVDERERTCPLW